ncbi:MAG: amino acid adenylation domain-containing protein [Chloroflexi bacterium]|nr:amino acid adenylation domain-containing protein [Chloroflexota bacterium]
MALQANDVTDVEQLCLHDLFAAQAEKTPKATSLVFEDVALTFAELNGRSNQLAHFLRGQGVGPDTFVGIYLQRSWEMVLALLGILKAGGAYVSLDPHAPAERVGFMMADTEMDVVLTQSSLLEKLPENRVTAVSLDSDWSTIAIEPDKNPSQLTVPENAVYVLFTSGSTGTPKGVVVEHRQLLNYLFSIQERLQIPAGIRFATVSTFAADLGNTAVFPPLCFGGELHVISEERIANPDAFAAYFRQHQIDFLKIVPSHLHALLNASQPADVLPRQRLILGGEASSWELIDTLQTLKVESCQLYNHCGPTETTVGVLTYPVPDKPKREAAALPLGKPIDHTQVFIVDDQLQPIAAGEVGELLIGGRNVSRGYLNRPELTAEKYISNPFSQTPGARLYRTGDLVRKLSSGDFEFLGRIDDQVKIRGYRVELGEVQACLTTHPQVREAVMVAREDAPGVKRLVAYIVAQPTAAPTVSKLRQHILISLPEYMVPAAFVFLDALPLNANGKINRRALPSPENRRPQLTIPFVSPTTKIEASLVQIFADVLQIDHVGIDDNFFDLGGDSILSIQIVARAGQAGQYFTPQHLFQQQTVAKLAEIVTNNPVVLAETAVSPLPLDYPDGLNKNHESDHFTPSDFPDLEMNQEELDNLLDDLDNLLIE